MTKKIMLKSTLSKHNFSFSELHPWSAGDAEGGPKGLLPLLEGSVQGA